MTNKYFCLAVGLPSSALITYLGYYQDDKGIYSEYWLIFFIGIFAIQCLVWFIYKKLTS